MFRCTIALKAKGTLLILLLLGGKIAECHANVGIRQYRRSASSRSELNLNAILRAHALARWLQHRTGNVSPFLKEARVDKLVDNFGNDANSILDVAVLKDTTLGKEASSMPSQPEGQWPDDGHQHGGLQQVKLDQLPTRMDKQQYKLTLAVYLAFGFMLVEVFGGIFAESLAIITDAAHMMSDVGGFLVSIIGLRLAARGATKEYTFGFKQAEILGALFSLAIVWALTAILLENAVTRFIQPVEINAPVMFSISIVGLIVNILLMKVLGHGNGHSHSHGHGHGHARNHGRDHGHGHAHGGTNGGDASVAMKAAIAHVVGDIVQSLGVCLASVLIWLKPFDIGTVGGVSRWNYADPLCTILFGILVLLTTKSTCVSIVNTLMAKVPKHIDQFKLMKDLNQIPHVDGVHDLHVWSLGSTEVLCTAHVMVTGAAHVTSALKMAVSVAEKAGIGHSTFQIEIVGEFDPALESYGNLHRNEITGGGFDGQAIHAHDSRNEIVGGGFDDHATHAHDSSEFRWRDARDDGVKSSEYGVGHGHGEHGSHQAEGHGHGEKHVEEHGEQSDQYGEHSSAHSEHDSEHAEHANHGGEHGRTIKALSFLM